MDEITKKTIKENADDIRAGLHNSTLFGFPIDINDTDMVLVAAVLKAEQCQLSEELDGRPSEVARSRASYILSKLSFYA